MEKVYKLMIADDHQLFLDGMVRILGDEPDLEVIGFFNSGTGLLHALNGALPDLIILDVQMYGLNGIETSVEIKKRHPNVKLLIVSMHDSLKVIQDGKRVGINGFIPKTADAADVKDTIREILEGKEVFIRTGQVPREEKEFADVFLLSKRELEIIQLIKKGYRTKKIADELNISSYTVETHRKNIFRKVKVDSVSELVAFAYSQNI